MRRPQRNDYKYWKGTKTFKHLEFEDDLNDYIDYLEVKLHEALNKKEK